MPRALQVVAAVKKVAAPLPSAPSGSGVLAFGASAPVGFWDPLSLAADKSEETLSWYRAAELKHGRVAMLACLGSWTNAWGITLPDPVFSSGPTAKSFDVLAKVASERPGALIQILLAIAAIEVLTVQQPEGAFPGQLIQRRDHQKTEGNVFVGVGVSVYGIFFRSCTTDLFSVRLSLVTSAGDLLWDPANQIPKFEAQGKFDELRLKELKNGRLAMLAIAGEWAQEALTGQGVFEQLAAGHTNPFGDGQGFF
ncbi:unnamed protein product [Phaeothamnion confervicola]